MSINERDRILYDYRNGNGSYNNKKDNFYYFCKNSVNSTPYRNSTPSGNSSNSSNIPFNSNGYYYSSCIFN